MVSTTDVFGSSVAICVGHHIVMCLAVIEMFVHSTTSNKQPASSKHMPVSLALRGGAPLVTAFGALGVFVAFADLLLDFVAFADLLLVTSAWPTLVPLARRRALLSRSRTCCTSALVVVGAMQARVAVVASTMKMGEVNMVGQEAGWSGIRAGMKEVVTLIALRRKLFFLQQRQKIQNCL